MVVAGTLLFPNLSYPLIEPDEGRYAEIPREMIASGDWIVPTFHFRPYLDKPPLFYWLCAASYKIFGPTDWAARLVPAASAFLTVLLTFLFGSRILGTRSAFLGALTMCLSLGFVYCGRYLILDSLLTLFVTLSMFLAYEAVGRGKFQWSWWIASAVACGLGFLTKGPVALLLLAPPLAAFCWLSRWKTGPRFGAWMVYAFASVAVAAPWYVAVSLREPGFVHHFFWVHNFGRFLYSVSHPQPFWYYAPVLVLGLDALGVALAAAGGVFGEAIQGNPRGPSAGGGIFRVVGRLVRGIFLAVQGKAAAVHHAGLAGDCPGAWTFSGFDGGLVTPAASPMESVARAVSERSVRVVRCGNHRLRGGVSDAVGGILRRRAMNWHSGSPRSRRSACFTNAGLRSVCAACLP